MANWICRVYIKKVGYGKHMPSRLFQYIVDMYQNHRDEFELIYESTICISNDNEAQVRIEEKEDIMPERKGLFIKWLSKRNENKKNENKKNEYICSALDDASTYALNHKVSQNSIWNVENLFELKLFFDRLSKDKIYKVVHKNYAKILFQAEKLYLEYFEEASNECDSKEEQIDIEKEIVKVVSEKYVYGYRLGSVIERMKLRDYLAERNLLFCGSDDELEELIIRNGFVNNGKVLMEWENKNEKLNQEIDSVFQRGVAVIYYVTFFELHAELMAKVHISSDILLKTFLKEKRKDLTFSKNFFSLGEKITEDLAVAQEIIRVWGDNVLASVDELAGKLPYIPYDKVRFYLSQNQNFVWVSEGMYTRLSSIKIPDEEKKNIMDRAAVEIERKGYVSLNELPLENVFEENYELSEYAVLYGTYGRCLSKQYSLHGRIVTKQDAEFDATILMQQFCSDQDEITLDAAISKVEELTGVADRRVAYPALYETMVRVSERLFVSQKKIHFDIERIDEQISRFATDGFIALKEITTFALFPECGYSWNQYILESYCYRFSKKYVYRTNLFNGKNAGALIDKSIMWDYQEIMAQAVARSKIVLNDDIVGHFLYDTGYMSRSKFGSIKDIVERAKRIREDKD